MCSFQSLVTVTLGFDLFSEGEETLGPVAIRPHSLFHLNIDTGIVFFLLIFPNLRFKEALTSVSSSKEVPIPQEFTPVTPSAFSFRCGLDAALPLRKRLSGNSSCLP